MAKSAPFTPSRSMRSLEHNAALAAVPKSEPMTFPIIEYDRTELLEIDDPGGTEHLHWTIQGYQGRYANGQLHDVVAVSLEAPTEEQALARAAKIIDRAYYRVTNVSEACKFTPELTRAKED